MSDDRMDRLLRDTLADRERPGLAAGFERRVLARAREDHERRLNAKGRRWLTTYIAGAALASAFIVARIDWPSIPPGMVAILAPLSFGLTLGAPELLRRLKGG
jgi:hypothetical protein